jgi:hypothetical protein
MGFRFLREAHLKSKYGGEVKPASLKQSDVQQRQL